MNGPADVPADAPLPRAQVHGTPPPEVRAAFGAIDEPQVLSGGAGITWRAGSVILKPVRDVRAARWVAELYSGLTGPGFRVPRPIRASGGDWVCGGWTAWVRLEGEPDPVGRWPALVAASRAFHTALAGVSAPDWLGTDGSPWTTGDQVAWGEQEITVAEELRGGYEALASAIRPVDLPSQLIHGDIAGNVLFARRRLPAVIDFSPYRRPAGFSLAVAAVDVLAWNGAQPSILDELADEPEIDQLLVRALIYRLVTESCLRRDGESLAAVRSAHERVIDLVLARLAGRGA